MNLLCRQMLTKMENIYLEHPAVWYTAEGGITALDVMLSDLEESL